MDCELNKVCATCDSYDNPCDGGNGEGCGLWQPKEDKDDEYSVSNMTITQIEAELERLGLTSKVKQNLILVDQLIVRECKRLNEELKVLADKLAGQMEECIAYDEEGKFCGFNHKSAENILLAALRNVGR
jgi:hypothetical protein